MTRARRAACALALAALLLRVTRRLGLDECLEVGQPPEQPASS